MVEFQSFGVESVFYPIHAKLNQLTLILLRIKRHYLNVRKQSLSVLEFKKSSLPTGLTVFKVGSFPERFIYYYFISFYLLSSKSQCRKYYFLYRKTLSSVVGVFFLFPKRPMTSQVHVCRIVGGFYNTNKWWH